MMSLNNLLSLWLAVPDVDAAKWVTVGSIRGRRCTINNGNIKMSCKYLRGGSEWLVHHNLLYRSLPNDSHSSFPPEQLLSQLVSGCMQQDMINEWCNYGWCTPKNP
jgi:hypothetical protein